MEVTAHNLAINGPVTSGARAGSLLMVVRSHLRRLWYGLEHIGQRRAARELALTARRFEAIDPELAAHLRLQALSWAER
jgi:hypothetical protein